MERCAHNAEKRLLMTDSGMTERGSNSPNYPIGHKKHLPLPSKQTALRKDPTKQPKKGALYFLSIMDLVIEGDRLGHCRRPPEDHRPGYQDHDDPGEPQSQPSPFHKGPKSHDKGYCRRETA
jgi:hypothetical protein